MSSRYQTHDDKERGMSDSHKKLERLRLPDDMRGMRFLDIGCNEGYFCNAAAERGARVVGIDFFEPALSFARERYRSDSIDFRLQTWEQLPEGQFDVVLWSSAMHYEREPGKIIANIFNSLNSTGLLILECGVYASLSREMVRIIRHSDARWYPTYEYLTEELLGSKFAVRQVAWGETTEGDPVPRSVFHCYKRLPVVALVRGPSLDGKSNMAAVLKPTASKVIMMDLFFYRVFVSEFHHTKLDQYIRDHFDPNDLTSLYSGIDSTGLTEALAQELSNAMSLSDQLVVLDGAITEPQAQALARAVSGRALVWDIQRVRHPT